MKHVFTLLAFTMMSSGLAQVLDNLALEFSGISDYLGPNAGILEVPFADALDRTGSESFTIASDVLFDADGFPYALYHTGQDGDPENSIRFNIATSELEFMWENNGADYKLECALSTTSVGTLATGVWHNVAASWDGVNLTLFVNGIEVASDSPMNGGPGETEDRPFYWGSHLGGNELDGQLDNAQFWTIGLTEEDIQSYLDCPPAGSELGLEAFWTFDGPDSDLILDITGNGHHGFAQGVQKVPSTRPGCPITSGCTDPEACNFNPEAEEDDGSCLPYDSTLGCTDSVACNYSPIAVCDDASCVYPPFNLANCDEGEVSCGPGTYWDSESQTCIVLAPSDTDFDGCVGMIDLLDLLSVFGTCAEVPWECGDPLEYQGYDYATVQIGEQCWFAENSRILVSVAPASEYSLSQPLSYVYGYNGNSVEEAKMTSSYSTYGVLYNFQATQQWDLCPSGWHVPSDEDWMELEYSLGLQQDSLSVVGYRGHLVGASMKSQDLWNGNNQSGLEMLAGGGTVDSGEFVFEGERGWYWTSTEAPAQAAWFRQLETSQSAVYRAHWNQNQQSGHSVRCIQGSE